LDVQPGWEWAADVTATLWIAFGMGAVSWMKVWMAKPTFNTGTSSCLPDFLSLVHQFVCIVACTMTTIILFMV
ncbi:uncharacterized protein FOMMEDRAFT_86332, partial [Fomitiporia mediterranea MF3/22]|uniref:uncharacterized protein n=1 Tax=Fomitiporia mediterranea (strain MF3/22) TaxID=694068 RepID=UPI000440850C